MKGKPVGWKNESGRHSLAARGIPTTMGSRGVSTAPESVDYNAIETFNGLHKQIHSLENGVEQGDPESMESFILIADEIITDAENLGLGREKYIRHLRKAQSNIERALVNQQFLYKYIRKTHRPFQITFPGEKVYRSKADDDLHYVLIDNSYRDFVMKLKDMELRRRIF